MKLAAAALLAGAAAPARTAPLPGATRLADEDGQFMADVRRAMANASNRYSSSSDAAVSSAGYLCFITPADAFWVRSNAHRLWCQHVITWRGVVENKTRVIT